MTTNTTSNNASFILILYKKSIKRGIFKIHHFLQRRKNAKIKGKNVKLAKLSRFMYINRQL